MMEATDLVIAIEVVYVASSTNLSVISLVAECEGKKCDRNDSKLRCVWSLIYLQRGYNHAM